MTPPDNQPPERKPSLYQMTAQPERKGGGGTIALVAVLLLAGAGAAYYFMQQKPTAPGANTLPAAPTPAPQAPAPATVAATPTGYNSVTEQSYINNADEAFRAVQQPKKLAFTEAFAAFQAAGGASSRGLTSKEAITARRDLIAKCTAANDDYANFVTTQETFYKAELAKTPLTPSDQEATFKGYVEKAKTASVLKLRQAQHDSLKTADDIMALLEKSYGNWSSAAAGRLTFKRPPDEAAYRNLGQKYTTEVAQLNQLNNELKGTVASGDAAPSGSDDPSAGAAAPTASPAAPSAPAASPTASP